MTNAWQSTASIEVLKQRAALFGSIRQFFAERDVLEVDTTILSQAATTELHLHTLQTHVAAMPGTATYLNTSPEYQMKRLLASGSGDIYQIAKVFRDDERGQHHHPEFSLLEWYRVGWDAEQLREELLDLIKALAKSIAGIDQLTCVTKTYSELFEEYIGFNPLLVAIPHDITKTIPSIPAEFSTWDKAQQLDWLFSEVVLPTQDPNVCLFIIDYPAAQASLAKLDPTNPQVAQRFECVWRGLELANGFTELTDAAEQRARFDHDQKIRRMQGLPVVPMDQRFLQALESGLPECAGVALGLDRLLMVLLELKRIDEVLAFPIERA